MRLFFILILSTPVFLFGQKQDFISELKALKQSRLDTITSVLKINQNDTVADIGSGDGYNLIRLSKYYPSVKYFVEDIDSSKLNKANFLKNIKLFNSSLSIDNFEFVYGTTTSTNLPKNYFTKVIMIAVVHEFDDKQSMFSDIKSILKTTGHIFIEEPLVTKNTRKDKGCNNPYLTESEFKKILKDNGIEIETEKNIKDIGGIKYRKIFKCRKATANIGVRQLGLDPIAHLTSVQIHALVPSRRNAIWYLFVTSTFVT